MHGVQLNGTPSGLAALRGAKPMSGSAEPLAVVLAASVPTVSMSFAFVQATLPATQHLGGQTGDPGQQCTAAAGGCSPALCTDTQFVAASSGC